MCFEVEYAQEFFVPCMGDLGCFVCFCFKALRVMIGQFEALFPSKGFGHVSGRCAASM